MVAFESGAADAREPRTGVRVPPTSSPTLSHPFSSVSSPAETEEPSIELTTSEDDPAGWSRADFTRLVSPHLSHLHRLALILARDDGEAADLLQNSLVQAYVHRAAYEGRGSVVAWLYGIVRHQHAERLRSRLRRRSLLEAALQRFAGLLDDLAGERPAPSDPEQLAIASEETELVVACLRRVREPYRTVVFLADVEEVSYEEIASRLDVPIGTVKSRHARGRAELRAAFDRVARDQEVSRG